LADVDKSGIGRPLRAHLRDSTRTIHARLDQSVSRSDWTRPTAYARFLASQLEAREPVEQWARRHCPPQLRPPETSTLLREDLHDLECDIAGVGGTPFALPEGSDPLGLAWAIAGSQMGNRAMLAQLRKAGREHGGESGGLPVRFLSDPRMDGFWRSILPYLKREVVQEAARPAISAALAVFARFEEAFTGHHVRSAAA